MTQDTHEKVNLWLFGVFCGALLIRVAYVVKELL